MSRRAVNTLTSFLFCVAFAEVAGAQQQSKLTDVEATDTACFAAINFGAGGMAFNVCISDTGRVTQITSPAGVAHILGTSGHYYLCDSRLPGVYGGDGGRDFSVFSITQPNGPNTLPLTIVTRTFDNLWEVKHVFTRNTNELELVVTQTLKNLGGTVADVSFARFADTAIDGGDAGDIGDRSRDSVTMRDRPGDDTTTGNMLTLTALTRTVVRTTAVGFYLDVRGCNPASAASPFGPADAGFNLTYNLGVFDFLKTKVVKFKFERK